MARVTPTRSASWASAAVHSVQTLNDFLACDEGGVILRRSGAVRSAYWLPASDSASRSALISSKWWRVVPVTVLVRVAIPSGALAGAVTWAKLARIFSVSMNSNWWRLVRYSAG